MSTELARSRSDRNVSIDVRVGGDCTIGRERGPKAREYLEREDNTEDGWSIGLNWSVGCLKMGCGRVTVTDDVGSVDRARLSRKGGDRRTDTRPGPNPPARVLGRQAGAGTLQRVGRWDNASSTGSDIAGYHPRMPRAGRRAGEVGEEQIEDLEEDALSSPSLLRGGGEREIECERGRWCCPVDCFPNQRNMGRVRAEVEGSELDEENGAIGGCTRGGDHVARWRCPLRPTHTSER